MGIATILWGFLAVVFLIIELLIPSLVSIWLSISALLTMILAYYIENTTLLTIFFLIMSLILVLSTKPLIKKITKSNDEYHPDMKGQIIEIIEKLDDNNYNVRYKGVIWSAVSDNEVFEVGDKVKILSLKGNKINIGKE